MATASANFTEGEIMLIETHDNVNKDNETMQIEMIEKRCFLIDGSLLGNSCKFLNLKC